MGNQLGRRTRHADPQGSGDPASDHPVGRRNPTAIAARNSTVYFTGSDSRLYTWGYDLQVRWVTASSHSVPRCRPSSPVDSVTAPDDFHRPGGGRRRTPGGGGPISAGWNLVAVAGGSRADGATMVVRSRPAGEDQVSAAFSSTVSPSSATIKRTVRDRRVASLPTRTGGLRGSARVDPPPVACMRSVI